MVEKESEPFQFTFNGFLKGKECDEMIFPTCDPGV